MTENTVVEFTPLTSEEDTFALGVIEYGGNLGAAYRAAFGAEISNPVAKARHMISRPEIAKRIMQLTEATQEHALISLGSHLVQLAEIRDLAKDTGQLKVALSAEQARGEVAGFYQGKGAGGRGSDNTPNASVIINMAPTPANMEEWAAQHGKMPIVIDMPT